MVSEAACRGWPERPERLEIPYFWPVFGALFLDSWRLPGVRPLTRRGNFSRRLFLCDRPDRSNTRAAPTAQRFRDDQLMIAVNP